MLKKKINNKLRIFIFALCTLIIIVFCLVFLIRFLILQQIAEILDDNIIRLSSNDLDSTGKEIVGEYACKMYQIKIEKLRYCNFFYEKNTVLIVFRQNNWCTINYAKSLYREAFLILQFDDSEQSIILEDW